VYAKYGMSVSLLIFRIFRSLIVIFQHCYAGIPTSSYANNPDQQASDEGRRIIAELCPFTTTCHNSVLAPCTRKSLLINE